MSNKKDNRTIKKSKQSKILKSGEEVHLISSLGVKVRLLPISPYLLDNVKNKADEDWLHGYTDEKGKDFEGREFPTIPTYTVTLNNTDVEMEHDLTTLDDTEDEEEKKQNWIDWEDYQTGLADYNTFQTTRASRVIIHGAIDCVYPPQNEDGTEDTKWADVQKYIMHADVPEEEPFRKMHYIETMILGSKEDLELVIIEVMALIGVDRKEVDRIKSEVFQGNVSRSTAGESKVEGEKSVGSK